MITHSDIDGPRVHVYRRSGYRVWSVAIGDDPPWGVHFYIASHTTKTSANAHARRIRAALRGR